VAACSFTLSVIAMERYQAICKPLQSRHWKTKKHALAMIFMSWGLAFVCTVPSAWNSELVRLDTGIKRTNLIFHWSTTRRFFRSDKLSRKMAPLGPRHLSGIHNVGTVDSSTDLHVHPVQSGNKDLVARNPVGQEGHLIQRRLHEWINGNQK